MANRSQSITAPDFTNGSWRTNLPHEINLESGGTTKVLEATELNEEIKPLV